MVTSEKVKDFYDGFSKNILRNEFYNYSLRQDAIKKLCRKYIPHNARILEMGCGVGIITKFVQKNAEFVLAVDISSTNVGVAQIYADSENTKFDVIDITKETDKIKSFGKFDVILIFDVIEHIEKSNYKQLFSILEDLLTDSGIILLTYPSAEYQQHLKNHNPQALQVIDQEVYLTDILNSITRLFPYYYSYKHIWDKDQYIHLVLKSNVNYPVKYNRGLWDNISYRLKKYSWRYSNTSVKKRINEFLSKK